MASGAGLHDWVIQRLTALFLGIFTCIIVVFLLRHSDLSYEQWQAFFGQSWVQILTLLALLSLVMHAWIGVRTIATDYLKVTFIRLSFQALAIFLLFGYFAWGIKILWG